MSAEPASTRDLLRLRALGELRRLDVAEVTAELAERLIRRAEREGRAWRAELDAEPGRAYSFAEGEAA